MSGLVSRKVSIEEHNSAIGALRSVIDGLREELAEVRRAAAEPSEWLERVKTQKVLFHLKDGSSIEGLLVRNLADGVALTAASLLNSGAPATRMAGEVFIPRENVLLAQLDR